MYDFNKINKISEIINKVSVIFRYIKFRVVFGSVSGFGIREINTCSETKFRYIPKPKGFREVSVSGPMFNHYLYLLYEKKVYLKFIQYTINKKYIYCINCT